MRRPICVIGLAFVIMIFFYLYWQPYPEDACSLQDRSTVCVIGQVSQKEYRISKGQPVLVVYLKEVYQSSKLSNLENQSKSAYLLNSKNPSLSKIQPIGLICYLKQDKSVQEPEIGSIVQVQGTFFAFVHAANKGEFDSKNYYRILQLHGRIQKAEILAKSIEYDKFAETLYQIKQYMAMLFDACLSEKNASVMKAMLLGEKHLLEEEIKELYQMNGIIHIVSISGLHISLLGMGLYKILCKLKIPKGISIPVSIGMLYCFGVMTGMGVSAVRAILMFGINLSAKLWKRTYDMLTAMTIAAIFLLIEQPLYLYHSGFLFSFGAILGIGILFPVLEENWFIHIKKLPNIEKTISIQLAVSIATLPVSLYFYYEYPMYSLLLNILVLPCMGILFADGVLCIIGAAISLPLGKLLVFPAQSLLLAYEMLCELFARLPDSRYVTGQPQVWQIFLFLLLLACILCLQKNMTKLQVWLCLLTAMLCLTMRISDGLQITFIDVGQGDGIYLTDGEGGHFLIDGGSSSKKEVGKYQIIPFLKAEGVRKLDMVFVTHLDDDHYNGILELLETNGKSGITIAQIVLPDICEENQDKAYASLVQTAKAQGVTVLYCKHGDRITHDSLHFVCLHPKGCSKKGNPMAACMAQGHDGNEDSMVLYLEYQNFTALFTGDLEGAGEREVEQIMEKWTEDGQADNYKLHLPLTLLKVAHHGSKNSTSERLLSLLQPAYAVISCGIDNSYGHPHEELLERLENTGTVIYQTSQSGAITVYVRKNRMRIEEFGEGKKL